MLLSLCLALAPQFTAPPVELPSFDAALDNTPPIEQRIEFRFEDHATAGIELRIIGPCPGVVTVTVAFGVPFQTCHVGWAWTTGSYVVPSGPCAGTVLGLGAPVTPVPGSPFTFDALGQVAFTATVPAIACGNVWVQALQSPTCCTSNVIAL